MNLQFYTVKHALYRAYLHTPQNGFSRAITSYMWIFAVNRAIMYIYNYNGHLWSFLHWKDVFTNLSGSPLKLVTTWPVRKIDSFYCGKTTPIQADNRYGLCECITPEVEECGPYIQPSCCECSGGTRITGLTKRNPHNELRPGDYSIGGTDFIFNPEGPGGCLYHGKCHDAISQQEPRNCADSNSANPHPYSIKGVGGLNGRVIRFNPPCNVCKFSCNSCCTTQCACSSCYKSCSCFEENNGQDTTTTAAGGCEGIRASYYRGFMPVTSYYDVVHLPANFMDAFGYLVAHYVLFGHGQQREYEDSRYKRYADESLNNLIRSETGEHAKFMEESEEQPYSSDIPGEESMGGIGGSCATPSPYGCGD